VKRNKRELKREFISPVWYGGFEEKIKMQIKMDGVDLLFFYEEHNSHPISTPPLGN
jgi:hypothetical protein